MRMALVHGNEYFDTYHIFDDQGNKVGIIEDHCRGVKKQYFVGWKLNFDALGSGKTQSFDTKEEAMIYSVGEVVEEVLATLRTTKESLSSTIDYAKKYLSQGISVTIEPTDDGKFTITRKNKKEV